MTMTKTCVRSLDGQRWLHRLLSWAWHLQEISNGRKVKEEPGKVSQRPRSVGWKERDWWNLSEGCPSLQGLHRFWATSWAHIGQGDKVPGSKEGRVEVELNQLKNSRSEAKLLPLSVTCLLEFFPESRLLASMKQEFILISWACVETACLTQNYRNHINRQNQDRGKHCKDFEVI